MLAKEEDEFVVEGEGDKDRFIAARNEDNLVTPFQCNWGHFQN